MAVVQKSVVYCLNNDLSYHSQLIHQASLIRVLLSATLKLLIFCK